jgi:hypothetical protein
MRFQVFMAMKMSMLIFCAVTPCGLVDRLPTFRRNIMPPSSGPEDGEITFLRNIGNLRTCPHGVTAQKINIYETQINVFSTRLAYLLSMLFI